MKQKIVTLLTVLVWFSVMVVAILCINKESVSMYESRKDTQIVQVDEYLYMEQGCSDTEIEMIQTLLGYLPQSFLKEFEQKNGKVILVSDLKGNCIGHTEIDKNSITIYINDNYAFDALIHEFGHVYLHFHPMEDDFREIYKTEAKSLVNAYYGDSPYYYSNEVESFAQAFQTVVCMRGYDTQDAAPKTFSYMNDLIKSMLVNK